MNNRDTIQILREIIAEMGRDNVCQNPHAFAGAILDMCDVDDVKLLTTVLRSHYSTKLMEWFRNGGNDAATWMQQKAFLINESGMYSLILSSKLEGAKRFKRWVTSEILPSIRKTGAYATDSTTGNIGTRPFAWRCRSLRETSRSDAPHIFRFRTYMAGSLPDRGFPVICLATSQLQ